MAKYWKPGEIVVEIAMRNNGYHMLSSFGSEAKFRGRWSNRNLKEITSGQAPDMTRLPDLPGICIALDVKGRLLRAVDPLGFPENAETLKYAVGILKASNFGEMGPWPTSVKQALTDTEIKSALWEMFQMVENGSAMVVSGDMPSREHILKEMPGELQIRWTQQFNVIKNAFDSPYATPEEIDKLMAGPATGIEYEPWRQRDRGPAPMTVG